MINQFNVGERDLSTKPVILRNQKIVPGIVYGPDLKESLPIQTEVNEMVRAMHMDGEIYQINHKGKKLLVKFDEIQKHPVSHKFVHFSLVQLSQGVDSSVEVPIHAIGEAKGVKEGGIIVILKDHITLLGKPMDLPGHIDYDVTAMEIGDVIHAKDLKLPHNIKLDEDEDTNMIACRPPAKEEPETETSTEALEEGGEAPAPEASSEESTEE